MRKVLLLFSISIVLQLNAQFYPSKVFKLDDGIPNYSVFDITQDDDLVMWFISSSGIFSYNSVDWELQPDSLNLPNTPNALFHKTKNGTLYVAGNNDTEFTIDFYKDDKWTKVRLSDTIKSYFGHFNFYVTDKNNPEIILFQESNYYRLNLQGEILAHRKIKSSSRFLTRSVSKIRDKTVVISNEGVFALKNDSLIVHPINTLISNEQEILMIKEFENSLYVLSTKWIGKIDSNKFEVILEDNGITEPSVYNKHNLLFFNDNIFYSSQTIPYHLEPGKNIKQEMIVNRLNFKHLSHRLYLDHENNLWVSDYRGLFLFDITGIQSFNDYVGLSSNEVTAVHEYNDTIVVANTNALNFIVNSTIVKTIKISDLDDFRIMDLQSYRNKLFIAANYNSLLIYEKGKIKEVNKSYLTNERSFNALEIHNNELYVASNMALYKWKNGSLNTFSDIQHNRNLKSLSKDELVLINYKSGVVIFNKFNDLAYYKSENSRLNTVYDVLKKGGEIILATSGGLAKLSNDGKIIPMEEPKLPEIYAIYSLLLDADERIWIGTNLGLKIWDGKDIYTLDEKKGLLGNETNRNALYEDDNKRIWIGTESGISFIDVEKFIGRSSPADIEIKKVTARNGDEIANGQAVKFNNNTLVFDFISITYKTKSPVTYRYKVLGYEDDWIETTENFLRFTNLPAGNYTFEIQALSIDEEWSESEIFNFAIESPFYRKWWFRVLIILLLSFSIFIIIRLRLRYLMNIKKKLEETVEERTKSLEEKTKEIKQQNEELKSQREEIGNINQELQNTIIELKSTQQQLIQKEKMSSLGIMAMGVAHEINNPLNYIQNGVKLLKQKVRENEDVDTPDINEIFTIVQEGVNRVNGIVKSLNQFTVVNAELVECDIHTILMNCVTILNNRFKENVKLHLKFSKEECIVTGNPASFHQIFFNLLTNAEESIEKKGNVYLETSNSHEKVIIFISDDGVGMSDETRSKAFDPFFSTKSPNQATGLGLSVVYTLIKELGGKINIESEFNKGTSVTVEFKKSQ